MLQLKKWKQKLYMSDITGLNAFWNLFFIIASSLKFAYGHPNQMLMFYIVFAVSYYSL